MSRAARTHISTQFAEPARVLFQNDDMALGCSSRIFFCLWRARTTTEGVARLASSIEEFVRTREPGLAIITIIESGAQVPDLEARKALSQLLKRPDGKIAMSAVAFEGDGFMAAVVRAVVTGLTGLTSQPFPHRVFANTQEIASWFESVRFKGKPLFPATETLRSEAEFRQLLRATTEKPAYYAGHRSTSRLRTRQ